jgi:hypothetical protein
MAIKGWINPSTRPANRTTFGESPSMSKAVRRYGVDGSKSDFPHASTGESHITKIDREGKGVAPSLAPETRGHIGAARTEVVGHAPDGSGKWLPTTHDRELIGNAIATHPRLEPAGMVHSASGGKHGTPSKVPTEKYEGHLHRADAGALAGDSRGGRPSYTGGKGRIQP